MKKHVENVMKAEASKRHQLQKKGKWKTIFRRKKNDNWKIEKEAREEMDKCYFIDCLVERIQRCFPLSYEEYIQAFITKKD